MKLLSWNVNGIRACIKKGFWDWFEEQDADVVCLQETKIAADDFEKLAVEHDLRPLLEDHQHLDIPGERATPLYYGLASAEKRGYSGVLTISKAKPIGTTLGLGDKQFDREGRTLITEFKNFFIVNAYFPNAQRELARMDYKLAYNKAMLAKCEELKKSGKAVIVCGDFNVAHTEIDIKNAKSNEKNAGFTPEERESFSQILDKGYLDTFRHLNPDARDVYSWWSYRANARARNIGWRIDYFIINKEAKAKLKSASVQMQQEGSDHCPVALELKMK